MSELSYYHHASDSPLLYMTLHERLDQLAIQIPDVEAYVFRKPGDIDSRSAISFKQLSERSTKLAAEFLKLGLKPGDRVAAMGPFCEEWTCVDFAALKAKILLVRITNEIMTAEVLKAMLSHNKCRALIIHPGEDEHFLTGLKEINGDMFSTDVSLKDFGYGILEFVISMTDETSLKLPAVRPMLTGMLSCEDHEEVLKIQNTAKPDDVAVLFVTSGSTGLPKTAAHTHLTVLNNFTLPMNGPFGITEIGKSRFFVDRPPTWAATFPYLPVTSGVTLINVDSKYTITKCEYNFLFRVFHEENVTCSLTPAYLIHDIVEAIEQRGFTLPRTWMNMATAGERLPVGTLRSMIKHIPNVTVVYGTTETFVTLNALLDNSRSDDMFFALKPSKHCEIKITDDKGNLVKRGEPGHMHVRSPYVFRGYLDDPERTAACLDSARWFSTSDYAMMLPDGHVVVIGRTIDVISRAMRKIFPENIERIVAEHSKVSKVAVIRVPDERLFEEVCACVIPKSDSELEEADLVDHCTKLMLVTESFDFIPRYFMFMEKFPETNGKISRNKLRAMAAQKFVSRYK